jgi:hypothetical protein
LLETRQYESLLQHVATVLAREGRELEEHDSAIPAVLEGFKILLDWRLGRFSAVVGFPRLLISHATRSVGSTMAPFLIQPLREGATRRLK